MQICRVGRPNGAKQEKRRSVSILAYSPPSQPSCLPLFCSNNNRLKHLSSRVTTNVETRKSWGVGMLRQHGNKGVLGQGYAPSTWKQGRLGAWVCYVNVETRSPWYVGILCQRGNKGILGCGYALPTCKQGRLGTWVYSVTVETRSSWNVGILRQRGNKGVLGLGYALSHSCESL